MDVGSMPTRRGRTAAVVAAAGLLVSSCSGTAGGTGGAGAEYPQRPITWIVSFDPGGGSDVEARRIQEQLQEELGTTINIEYRSGGGGAVGWAEAAQAEPDGHRVTGLVIPHILVQPLALDDTGYRTEDFRAAAWQVGAPAALLVAEDSEFEDLEDFVSHAEEDPGSVTVGGVETFSLSDLALAQFLRSAGIEVSYVPVTGGAGPLISDVVGGHVDAAMLGTSHAAGSDDVRPLAVGGEERAAAFPDVPTFGELGYEVTIAYAWGVGMPADTPEDVVTRFGEAVIAVMEDPEIQEELPDQGYDPVMIGPGEAQDYVDDQRDVYAELVPLAERLSD